MLAQSSSSDVIAEHRSFLVLTFADSGRITLALLRSATTGFALTGWPESPVPALCALLQYGGDSETDNKGDAGVKRGVLLGVIADNLIDRTPEELTHIALPAGLPNPISSQTRPVTLRRLPLSSVLPPLPRAALRKMNLGPESG